MPKVTITFSMAGGRRRAPRISYLDSPFTWDEDVAITEALPTNTGGSVASYSVVDGALPTGVSLNPTTGALTGTPTTAGSGSATIRATGDVGQHETTVTWEVA